MDPKAVMEFARENECRFVDVKFLDIVGSWQHISLPAKQLSEEFFINGRFLEGTAVRSCQQIGNCGLTVIPDPSTARLDPFTKAKTLSLIGNIHDPSTGGALSRDPRQVALRAESHLREAAGFDQALFAPEMEFYVFDEVRFDQNRNSGYYFVDSDEGRLNAARDEGGAAARQTYRDPYYPAPPADSMVDMRHEIVEELLLLGLGVTGEHHEGAGSGQGGVDLAAAGAVAQGDNLMWLKYVIKNIARRNCKAVTFMPKPLFEEAGSGMQTSQALFKGQENMFAGEGSAGYSQTGLWYAGGLLKHAAALSAFLNPTTNSYRRLLPGGDAPVNLALSAMNRAFAVGLNSLPANGGKALKFRLPDPSSNPYLAFAAMLMAGLDGIKNKIDPGPLVEKELSGLSQEELSQIPVAASSLEEALAALEDDHGFLIEGGVFSKDLIGLWIELKMELEVAGARARPTPWEFALYFDC